MTGWHRLASAGIAWHRLASAGIAAARKPMGRLDRQPDELKS
jgi:hypothetical protein